MTFTPGIPATGQSLGSSRTQVLNNFANYFNTVSQDHVAPNSTGQGKHNKSTYPDQAVDPVTIVNEIAAYAKSIGGISELFLRPENAGNTIQMSSLATGVGVGATNGWTFLPGAIILQWGRETFSDLNSALSVLFITNNINFPNNCFTVIPVGIGFANAFAVDSVTKTGFTADRYNVTGGLGSGQSFYWIAIGN